MTGKRNGMARFVRRVAALGLAGFMFFSCCGEAFAATLKDVFDEHYYADSNEDLKAAFGYDREALWNHFITFGIKEGRMMNELLDVVKYREQYADLDAAFGDDWDAYLNHYLTFGAKEGRDTGTSFNALDYAERYKDLKEVFGDDVLALWQHYKDYGSQENREARSESVVVAEKAAQEAARRAASSAQTKKSGYSKRVNYQDGAYGIYEYDENDLLIKRTGYTADGKIESWYVIEYNAAGERVKEVEYKADGTIRFQMDVEYDEAGNSVTRAYNAAAEDGSRPELLDIWYRDASGRALKHISYQDPSDPQHCYSTETEYNESGKLVKQINGYNGKVESKFEFEYDEDGNITQKTTRYDSDGNETESTVTRYDENWNVIE